MWPSCDAQDSHLVHSGCITHYRTIHTPTQSWMPNSISCCLKSRSFRNQSRCALFSSSWHTCVSLWDHDISPSHGQSDSQSACNCTLNLHVTSLSIFLLLQCLPALTAQLLQSFAEKVRSRAFLSVACMVALPLKTLERLAKIVTGDSGSPLTPPANSQHMSTVALAVRPRLSTCCQVMANAACFSAFHSRVPVNCCRPWLRLQ